jgi:hypothetical protein
MRYDASRRSARVDSAPVSASAVMSASAAAGSAATAGSFAAAMERTQPTPIRRAISSRGNLSAMEAATLGVDELLDAQEHRLEPVRRGPKSEARMAEPRRLHVGVSHDRGVRTW